MLFVGRKPTRHRISVTDLAFHITCPFLYINKKIFPKLTTAMLVGKEEHEKRYREHAEKAVPLSLRQAVKLSYEEKMVGREVWVSNGIVGGFVDFIEITNGHIRVVEYKTTERGASWLPSHIQAILYGTLVKDIGESVVVEVRTFDEELYFKKTIGSSDEEILLKGVEELELNTKRGIFPRRPGPHCSVCPFRDRCGEVWAARATRVHASPGAAQPPQEM